PFVGELKCIEVSPNDFTPSGGADAVNNRAGDLKGEATIVSVESDGDVDARKYNGIGLQSTAFNNSETSHDDILQIGGPNAEYNGCPNVILLDHLFDNAVVSTHKGSTIPPSSVTTHLTVIPCSEDFSLQERNLGGAVLQFLVFNEFEQRMSTSTNFKCFREVPLSDIDTAAGPSGNPQSIFNVGVQGTLAGQTRIRPVAGATGNGTPADNRILAVAE